MANKMLIDATHPEETRVVVLRGNRVEEFDFESAHRKQLRGNIYLAKVTRVEPSLQAAFVDYGGNRHGFLAFSEIHPDYYQIPIADRQALGGVVKQDDWNQYTVIARGGTFLHIVNGQLMAVMIDDDPASSNNQPGMFGIEIEATTKVSVRNMWVRKIS